MRTTKKYSRFYETGMIQDRHRSSRKLRVSPFGIVDTDGQSARARARARAGVGGDQSTLSYKKVSVIQSTLLYYFDG